MSDLKPCPFCGGEAQVMKIDLDSIDEGWKVWGVWCVNDLHAKDYYNHGHYIDNYPTEAEAIAAWNSRADYHGYEQAAIEAWESVKAWNSRAERTCRVLEHDELPSGLYKREEIVRCRDCKHFTPKGTHKFENGKVNEDYCDYVRGWMLQITPDGFCAWGARKEVDNDNQ